MKKVIDSIKKSVIPPSSLVISKKKIADLAFSLIKNEIKNFPEVVGIEFGGSYAKGTWLKKEADIDIFIKLKKSITEEKFENISKSIGFSAMKKYKPYVRYSDHPYVEAKIKNTKINVVPCYDVQVGDWKSAADRSPFHTKHIQEQLNDKMRNDVRILKTFLKSMGIYGAEISKQGFSGYVSEVLILNYGTFENTIKKISQIKENQIIGKTSKKFDTTIVIIDPIDDNRNLAAAISNQNIGKFVLACRAFQAKPSEQFFKKLKIKKSKDLENLLVVKFNFKIRSPDIIWGQIKRATSSLSKQLEIGGFTVLRSLAYTDESKEAYLFFLLESTTIPKNYTKKGPDYFRQDDSQKFIEKNISKTELMWISNNSKIMSLEKRTHNDAIKYMKNLLQKNLHVGIPKGLQDDIKNGVRVSLGNKNLRKSIKEVASEIISTDEKIFYSNKKIL